MVVKITPNDKGNPPGKLADAELHFTDGALQGLKLIGFAVWERAQRRRPQRHVPRAQLHRSTATGAPSRCCDRPAGDSQAQDRVRELILQAYAEHEAQVAVAS